MADGVTGWGYEGRTVDDLIAFARSLGASTVADVRLNALSRKKGLSKTALATALADAGIAYVHFPALGNPKDNRAGFALPGTADGEAARARFRDEVLGRPEAREAVERVAELGRDGGVVVLCFEADGQCCHRAQVLTALDALPVAAEVG